MFRQLRCSHVQVGGADRKRGLFREKMYIENGGGIDRKRGLFCEIYIENGIFL